MSWNTDLFYLLNASRQPADLVRVVAESLASGPVFVVPVLLTCLWVWGRPGRRPALLAVAAGVLLGQGLNQLLGMAWFEPRPFMVGVGHTWLAHVADNGFPSDHATLGWSLGFGLILTGASRPWGAVACLAALLAGWARVFLGVHFPIDVLASVPVGLAAGLAARALQPVAAVAGAPVEHLYEAMLRPLPRWLKVPRRPWP